MVTVLVISAAILLVAIILYVANRRNERERYDFITIIAHKFRTPLTHIKWSAENILDSSLDAYQKQSFADIRAANEKLIQLTGLLIELTDTDSAARAAYKFERLNGCDLIHEAETEAKTALHEKNLFIAVSCDDPTIFVKGDHTRLRFALDAILENACLYSTPGRNIELGLARHSRKAIFSVTDHGIGIDPHDQSRVFRKFFRAKNARAASTDGFGIGLYLAREVAKRHGGTIKFYSEGAGKGSTFSLIVPIAK